jgi:hypothetical protein
MNSSILFDRNGKQPNPHCLMQCLGYKPRAFVGRNGVIMSVNVAVMVVSVGFGVWDQVSDIIYYTSNSS